MYTLQLTYTDIRSITDYFPFGMEMAGRSWSGGGYRFGYNGQERNDEIEGSGNEYSFDFRESDSRLGGRFWSIDPLAPKYPELTPYQFAGNTPIWARELEGLESWYTTTENGDKQLIEGVAGPLSDSYAEDIGATDFGVTENVPDYSFSNQEIEDFAVWNITSASSEPGKCLGAAVTGSENLTKTDAGFRNSKGNNVLGGKTLYDLGENLERTGNAKELPTNQGKETTTIQNNPTASNTENSAYISGPAGAYHSMIIIQNTSENIYSIYDQGSGWDIKDATQQDVQSVINKIDNVQPTWGSRIWQIYKTTQQTVLYPIAK